MKETVHKAIFYSTYKDFSLPINDVLTVSEAGDIPESYLGRVHPRPD